MTVVAAAVPRHESIDQFHVFGDPGSASGGIVHSGKSLDAGVQNAAVQNPADMQALLFLAQCSAVCTNSSLNFDSESGNAMHIGESTEIALQLFAEKVGIPPATASQVIPSGSGLKHMLHMQI
jgi:magnesium-transporting ATPase (P-type)